MACSKSAVIAVKGIEKRSCVGGFNVTLGGFHVTLGVTMLIVILFRSVAGHFKPDHHFGFEAVSWYWHFVDVVWLLLFVFVYWV